MIEEEWKAIEGYESRYKVSNLGNIKTLPIIKGNHTGTYVQKKMIRKQVSNQKGYMRVSLTDNFGNTKTHSVHRLVAKAFIPNPDNLKEVNHKDFDKTNNSVENLEWCTRKYNLAYLDTKKRMMKNIDHKKIGIKHRKPVIGKKDNRVIKFDSVASASDYIGCVPTAIGNNLNGRSKTVCGWVFDYYNVD